MLAVGKKFGKIYTFVDFGNVNYWYERDEKDFDGKTLSRSEKLIVEVEKLAYFIEAFSEHKRFYFGLDLQKLKSFRIIAKSRNCFTKTITKPIQKIRHYLDDEETKLTTRQINFDHLGNFVYIPKCNFDVEICVDAIRLMENYETFCLFSSDADFANLLRFLKSRGKKVILVKAGFVQSSLLKQASLIISAQKIKKEITVKKQKSRF